jgi:hypothetical protein
MKPEVDYLKDPRNKAALEQVKLYLIKLKRISFPNIPLIQNSLKGRLRIVS